MRVLIIDDEEDTRSIFSMSLGLLGGIDVIEAGSGPEGINQAANENPDVIILDLLMPDMDGTQTFLALKEHPQTREIPVIFMTVKGMFSEFEALKSMGALAVIAKPFDPTTLTQMIKTILENNGYGHVTGNGAANIASEEPDPAPVPAVKPVEKLQGKQQESLAAPSPVAVDKGPQNGNMKDVHLPTSKPTNPGAERPAEGPRPGNSTGGKSSGAAKRPSELASNKPISPAQRILGKKKARGENSKKSGGKSGSK